MSEAEKKETDSPRVESVHDSEDELPAVRGAVPAKVWLVQILYLFERAAFYGLSQPLRASSIQCPILYWHMPGVKLT